MAKDIKKYNFKKPQIVSEICSIHHEHKVSLYGYTICMSCEKDKVAKEKAQLSSDFVNNHNREILKKYSLLNDNRTWNDSFKSFKTATLQESKILQKVVAITHEYLNTPDKQFNTIFTGNPGTGKTHLAMSVALNLNAKFTPAKKIAFFDTAVLFMKLKDAFNNPNSWWTENNVLNLVKNANLIVLDDLGSESAMQDYKQASQYTQQVLFKILSVQHRIIFTTNLSFSQMQNIYNPKLLSRMLENSQDHILKFDQIKDKRSGLILELPNNNQFTKQNRFN